MEYLNMSVEEKAFICASIEVYSENRKKDST